jgi:hypothetical protein
MQYSFSGMLPAWTPIKEQPMSTNSGRRLTGETLREDAQRTTYAWQDGLLAMVGISETQVRQIGELNATLFGSFGLFDPEQLRASFRTIAEGTREVATTQMAVAGELLRAPLWLTGIASPWDLQHRYARLLEAHRALAGAYFESITGWQRRVAGAAEQTTEQVASTLRSTVDTQIDGAERVSRDVTTAQAASVDAARTTVETVSAAAEHTTARVRETASRAAERLAHERTEREADAQDEQARTERGAARAERAREREQAEAARLRLAARVIKGNINRDGEKIYHLPGQANYEQVQAEQLFETEEQAQAAGFRRSQAAGGGTIKGKVNREGEKIYHLPEQANYDRLEPDQIFETEEQARANGFRPAQR